MWEDYGFNEWEVAEMEARMDAKLAAYENEIDEHEANEWYDENVADIYESIIDWYLERIDDEDLCERLRNL